MTFIIMVMTVGALVLAYWAISTNPNENAPKRVKQATEPVKAPRKQRSDKGMKRVKK